MSDMDRMGSYHRWVHGGREAEQKRAQEGAESFAEYQQRMAAHAGARVSAQERVLCMDGSERAQSAPAQQLQVETNVRGLHVSPPCAQRTFTRAEVLLLLASRKAMMEGLEFFAGAVQELDALRTIFERVE